MWRRRAEVAFVAVALVVLWLMPHSVRGDGEVRYLALDRLLSGGGLAMARYSIVGPLFAAPLWLLGHAAGWDPRETTAYFNVTLFTIFVVVMAREVRAWLSADATRSFAVLLAYGSMFTNHVQLFYGEVFTAVTVSLGVALLARGRDVGGWALVVLGVLNTPATLVGCGLVAIAKTLASRRWRHLAVPVVAFALTLVQNLLLRGSALASGYESDAGSPTALPYSGLPGFSYPFFFGALSLLVSFGKGLVFFTPGLFFPFRGARWPWLAFLAFVAGLLLVYARWWSWQGGGFWGPRFFLIASVPACFVLAAELEARERSLARNVLVLAATLLTVWVGANGLVFDQTGLDVCGRNDHYLEAFCNYVPEMSVLWHPFVDFGSSVPAKSRPLAIAACAWWAFVGLWIVAPVARQTIRQLAAAARDVTTRLRDATWRL